MGRPKTRVEDIKSINCWWRHKLKELEARGCLTDDGRIKVGPGFERVVVRKGRPRKARQLSYTEILCMIR